MSRIFILALAVLGALSASAEAASLSHSTSVKKSVERGVKIWRGASTNAAPASEAREARAEACKDIIIIVATPRWPTRHLRVHAVFSEGAEPPFAARLAYRSGTQGFWADRMAAGY